LFEFVGKYISISYLLTKMLLHLFFSLWLGCYFLSFAKYTKFMTNLFSISWPKKQFFFF